MRRLTRFDFSVTNRGSGNPLGPLAAWAAARSAWRQPSSGRSQKQRRTSVFCHALDFRSLIMTKAPSRQPFVPVMANPCAAPASLFVFAAGLVEMPGTGKLSCFLVKKHLNKASPVAMTTKKKPKVYITRKLPDAVETRMRELFDAELNIDDTPRTQAELVEAVRSADVLVPTSPTASMPR